MTYNIIEGQWYGNMKAIERVKILTEGGNYEWRWKCEDADGKIYYMRNRALYAKGIASPETDSKTKEEVDAYLENLEKDRKNQMALRKNYYREYISNAIKRAIPFNLTFDQFNNLISQNCAYCGQEPYVL